MRQRRRHRDLRAGNRVDAHHFLHGLVRHAVFSRGSEQLADIDAIGNFGEFNLRASDRFGNRELGDLEQFALGENQSIAIARAVEQIQMLVGV